MMNLMDDRLTLEIQAFLEPLNEVAPDGSPVFTATALRNSPDPVAEHAPPERPDVQSSDVFVDSPHGSPIRTRIYDSDTGSPNQPPVLYIHGGCWIFCDIESHDRICQHLCSLSGRRVISLDYRLAPEHPFPAALDDVLTVATQHVENGLIVAGDSAGGNLAAALALLARDRNDLTIRGQILLYPITDITRFDTPSYEEFERGYLLARDLMEWGAAQYAPDEATRHDPLISPLLADDLSGLPPALVITAEADVLRDEAEAYAARLQEAEVPDDTSSLRGNDSCVRSHGGYDSARTTSPAGMCRFHFRDHSALTHHPKVITPPSHVCSRIPPIHSTRNIGIGRDF